MFGSCSLNFTPLAHDWIRCKYAIQFLDDISCDFIFQVNACIVEQHSSCTRDWKCLGSWMLGPRCNICQECRFCILGTGCSEVGYAVLLDMNTIEILLMRNCYFWLLFLISTSVTALIFGFRFIIIVYAERIGVLAEFYHGKCSRRLVLLHEDTVCKEMREYRTRMHL